MAIQATATRTGETSNLAEVLERVLDKGIVIAGDIRVNLGEVELLSLQIRLVITSVDKAREMGMDWWMRNPAFTSTAPPVETPAEVAQLKARIDELESRFATAPAPAPKPSGARLRKR